MTHPEQAPDQDRLMGFFFDTSHPSPLPESAGFFGFNRLQEEISMLVGIVDIPNLSYKVQTLIDAGDLTTPVRHTVRPTHMFYLSLSTFSLLCASVDDFRAKLQAQGITLMSTEKAPIQYEAR